MVNFYCDEITNPIIFAAEFLSWKQNTTVKIITDTKTLEVNFNEKKEEKQEKQETGKHE